MLETLQLHLVPIDSEQPTAFGFSLEEEYSRTTPGAVAGFAERRARFLACTSCSNWERFEAGVSSEETAPGRVGLGPVGRLLDAI